MSRILWQDRKRTIFGLPLSLTVYRLTEDRLFIERGLLNKREEEIRLYRIIDLTLSRTFGQRIFGVGRIKCCSADKTAGDFVIGSIKRPREVKELLSEQVESQRRDRGVSTREFLEEEGHEQA